MFAIGDPFPPVTVRTTTNPLYALDSTAGRYVVLTFLASGSLAGAADFLAALHASGPLFDDDKACCFVVTNDPADVTAGTLRDRAPGIRVVWDLDQALARRCGTIESRSEREVRLRLMSFVLDPAQRIVEIVPVTDLATHLSAVRAVIEALPHPAAHDGFAPVLTVPGLLEPELCRAFIAAAERAGFEDSGFMTTDPATGQTIGMIDHRHKRRFDCTIEDEPLQRALQARVLRRLAPAMKQAFQFDLTRMERYLVACYEGGTGAGQGGWFRPHKDNTTKGTAHRRFAITIALNDDYEGGGLRFPEFGRRVYHAPAGGAVVFSCSLLHEAMPVTAGRRFCLLPFVYDEAAAQLRLENARYFADPEVARNVVASVLDQPVEAVAVPAPPAPPGPTAPPAQPGPTAPPVAAKPPRAIRARRSARAGARAG